MSRMIQLHGTTSETGAQYRGARANERTLNTSTYSIRQWGLKRENGLLRHSCTVLLETGAHCRGTRTNERAPSDKKYYIGQWGRKPRYGGLS